MIEIFEGPLCCNTGVCGTDPDQELVTFTADVDWLTRQGVAVRRANLAQDPVAFADSPIARTFVRMVGVEGLPLVVADEVTMVAGRYPSRAELARIAGIDAPTEASAGCCSDSSKSQTAQSGCCCSSEPVAIELGTRA